MEGARVLHSHSSQGRDEWGTDEFWAGVGECRGGADGLGVLTVTDVSSGPLCIGNCGLHSTASGKMRRSSLRMTNVGLDDWSLGVLG